MSAKSTASGFHGEKSTTSRDGGTGGSVPTQAGSGYITRSKSGGHDGGSGGGAAPDDTGHKYGVRKASNSAGSASRIADGVGGPLPSA